MVGRKFPAHYLLLIIRLLLYLHIIYYFMTQTGYFEKYFIKPFYRHYSDFKGKDSGRTALMTLLTWLVITVGVFGILIGLVGLLGPEVGFVCLAVIGGLWVLGSIVPLLAAFSRSRNSTEEDADDEKPVFLGIDKLLFAACCLFMIFGVLMMVTTLNSDELLGRPRGENTGNESKFVPDSVVEEPIFTYQAETPVEVVPDTMSDLTETDTVSVEESFDPTIAPPVEADTMSMEY